jgi:DNA/RNA-binding domain of Phe-tRNA-synthetase-like protein
MPGGLYKQKERPGFAGPLFVSVLRDKNRIREENEGEMVEIQVQQRIFEKYPTFRRGIVIATSIQNGGQSEALQSLLNEAVEEAGRNPIDLKADPRILIWNEAHREFGSNPNKFPPAHAALLKRVQKAGTQVPFINSVVAIMNFNSITDILPVGGDDVEHAGECLVLGFANGSETFVPLGSPDVEEHPLLDEVIYAAQPSGEVMCRRWNWRNGHNTRITEETRTIVMNVDALGEGSEARAKHTRDRVSAMLQVYCQAEVTVAMLSPSQPSYRCDG